MRPTRVLAAALMLAAAAVIATAGAGPVSSLPDQASPAGHEHAHSHGPDGLNLDPRGRAGRAASFPIDDSLSPSGWQSDPYDGGAPQADKADLPDLAGLP